MSAPFKTNKASIFKIGPIVFALMLSALPVLPGVVPEAHAMTAKERCEKRVSQLTTRGKKMSEASKKLQSRYIKVNTGWKAKLEENYKITLMVIEEPDLDTQHLTLIARMDTFQDAMKKYNDTKRPYIAERNEQIKGYKNFNPDCTTRAGQQQAQEKMRGLRADQQKLKFRAEAVPAVYASSVRPAIVEMRKARNELILAKRKLGSDFTATPKETVAAALTSNAARTDIGQSVDNDFQF